MKGEVAKHNIFLSFSPSLPPPASLFLLFLFFLPPLILSSHTHFTSFQVGVNLQSRRKQVQRADIAEGGCGGALTCEFDGRAPDHLPVAVEESE